MIAMIVKKKVFVTFGKDEGYFYVTIVRAGAYSLQRNI